ncbi:hypothetical protein N9I50_00835, partial [bacterium]|nr:hypothetical protein [bacterium]
EEFSAAKQRIIGEKPIQQTAEPPALIRTPVLSDGENKRGTWGLDLSIKDTGTDAKTLKTRQQIIKEKATPSAKTRGKQELDAKKAARKEPSASEYDQNVVWNAVVAAWKDRRSRKAARKERRADRLVEPSTRFGWPMNVGLAAGAITFVNSASRWPNPVPYTHLVGSLVEGASGYVAVGGISWLVRAGVRKMQR